MKKKIALTLALAVMLTIISSFSALAAGHTVKYYDEHGNQIMLGGMYYNTQGHPTYSATCYYLDDDGNPVYVGGCRAYYYDDDDNLVPGDYYYNTNGNAVSRPSSYPGGCGYGTYCYNANGNVVNGSFYYDNDGNPVAPPVTQMPAYRGGRGCCGRR